MLSPDDHVSVAHNTIMSIASVIAKQIIMKIFFCEQMNAPKQPNEKQEIKTGMQQIAPAGNLIQIETKIMKAFAMRSWNGQLHGKINSISSEIGKARFVAGIGYINKRSQIKNTTMKL